MPLLTVGRRYGRRLLDQGRAALLVAVAVFAVVVPTTSLAATFVRIPDVSLLAFQTDSAGKVWFRNVNQFDSAALGCCYSYYIDTTTAEGKNIFALILAAAAQHSGLWFGVPNGYAAGVVSYVGNW